MHLVKKYREVVYIVIFSLLSYLGFFKWMYAHNYYFEALINNIFIK